MMVHIIACQPTNNTHIGAGNINNDRKLIVVFNRVERPARGRSYVSCIEAYGCYCFQTKTIVEMFFKV